MPRSDPSNPLCPFDLLARTVANFLESLGWAGLLIR